MASIADDRARGRGWLARWRDPSGKQRTKSFERRKDAEAWLIKVEASKQTGDYVAPSGGRVLFGERFAVWFDTTVNLRPSTRARDESYAHSLILPTFEHRSLASIDHDAIQGWVATLSKNGYAPATVQKAHQVMSKAMASAVKARLIARNPCEGTDLPRVERVEQMFLTPAEVARLADAIDPRFRSFVLTAAYSGLRAGELFALRRGRVDLMRSTLEVVENLATVKSVHYFGPPKTRAGRRTVPLPRFVADVLAESIASMEPGGLVFPQKDGSPMRANNFRRRTWIRATCAAGLGEMVATEPGSTKTKYEGLRVHDLRHTAVAFWIAAGASPTEIARRAGHASVVTVLDRYGHLLPSETDTVTEALEAMARGAEKDADAGEVVNFRGR